MTNSMNSAPFVYAGMLAGRYGITIPGEGNWGGVPPASANDRMFVSQDLIDFGLRRIDITAMFDTLPDGTFDAGIEYEGTEGTLEVLPDSIRSPAGFQAGTDLPNYYFLKLSTETLLPGLYRVVLRDSEGTGGQNFTIVGASAVLR